MISIDIKNINQETVVKPNDFQFNGSLVAIPRIKSGEIAMNLIESIELNAFGGVSSINIKSNIP